MKTLIGIAVLVLAVSPAAAQDAIDLHTVTVHDSPADVADWPATVRIERLTMSVPAGLAFDTDGIPMSWDYHVPGWGVGAGCPADGCVLYTVWAVARVGEQLHAAGFIQMWSGRPATGAPILSDFHKNWAYARDRWGELTDYAPQPGDLMGFFLTAGNARDTTSVTSRRERSNVVLVHLPPGDVGVFNFAAADIPPAPPPSPIVTPSPIAPLPATDLAPLFLRLDVLERKIDDLRASLEQFHDEVRTNWKAVVKKVTEYSALIVPALLAGRASK